MLFVSIIIMTRIDLTFLILLMIIDSVIFMMLGLILWKFWNALVIRRIVRLGLALGLDCYAAILSIVLTVLSRFLMIINFPLYPR